MGTRIGTVDGMGSGMGGDPHAGTMPPMPPQGGMGEGGLPPGHPMIMEAAPTGAAPDTAR